MRLSNISNISLLAALVAAMPVASLSAQALSPYDVLIFHDFAMSNTEVNGRIAIGGNANLTNFGVGVDLPGYTDYSLVVGGNLTTNSGSIFNGRTYVGGTLDNTFTAFAYPPVGGTSPVDFASDQTRLTNLSDEYAGMVANGTTELLSGELNFIGTSSYNVFDVPIAMLQGGTAGYEFVTPVGATNIINVIGSSSSSAFNNTAYFFDCTQVQMSSTCESGTNNGTPADAALTLWNFNDQSILDINAPVHGSILAPRSDVTFGVGDVVGNVVAESATSSAELYNNRDFAGNGPTVTPEPGSMVLVATGLLGMIGYTRRKRVTQLVMVARRPANRP